TVATGTLEGVPSGGAVIDDTASSGRLRLRSWPRAVIGLRSTACRHIRTVTARRWLAVRQRLAARGRTIAAWRWPISPRRPRDRRSRMRWWTCWRRRAHRGSCTGGPPMRRRPPVRITLPVREVAAALRVPRSPAVVTVPIGPEREGDQGNPDRHSRAREDHGVTPGIDLQEIGVNPAAVGAGLHVAPGIRLLAAIHLERRARNQYRDSRV